MSTYKLCYFNARGFGEISRWIFAEAGQEYEDFRWERDDWPKHKPNSPTGQGPWLEVDGKKIAQSTAIARFLANRFNMSGKNEFEAAQVDMIIGCTQDFFNVFVPLFSEEDETRKAAAAKKIKEEKAPEALTRLENLLKANEAGAGFIVGKDLTWADMQVTIAVEVLGYFEMMPLLDAVATLKAHRERIMARPKIAAWIEKRPKTQY